jgi:hypothetical protein
VHALDDPVQLVQDGLGRNRVRRSRIVVALVDQNRARFVLPKLLIRACRLFKPTPNPK